MTKYLYRDGLGNITFHSNGEELLIDLVTLKKAIAKFDETMNQFDSTGINLFEILGMRNLSSFVGEVFAASLIIVSNGFFRKNPHQDGYPDLLAMTDIGKKEWDRLKDNLRDKKPFSPFPTGGIEVKATCGSVPTPAIFAKKGLSKPHIGDTRIDYLKSYDWKAHHRETENLLGLVWDFLHGKPVIVGIFYSDKLVEEDWGRIIQPKEGGGRTTSVSIMTRVGVGKMYEGWVAIVADLRYVEFFNRYNRSDLIN